MIVFLLILVVAAIGGVVAYVAMQYTGLSSSGSGGDPSRGFTSGWADRGGSFSERVAGAPSGCLVAVLVAAGVWIAAWLVVLVLGLRVFTA